MFTQYLGGAFLGRKLYETLLSSGEINNIYDAMGSTDLSDVVLTTLNILRKTGNIPIVEKTLKCEAQSDQLRQLGNESFEKARYKDAFFLYNEALLIAPYNSNALKLAYGNRSAVLHKLGKYQECIIDIDKCLSLSNCPESLVSKLTKRRADATLLQQNKPNCESPFNKYFKLKSIHRQIPCASKYVKIIHEGRKPKIVAASDITVGTVLAIEKAYVSHPEKTFNRACCHFCHKFSLNLIPCERCSYAYFCSKECKDCCLTQYHKIECQLMDLIKLILGLYEALMFKAVLKLVLSTAWKELIKISHTLNVEVDKSEYNLNEKVFDIHNMFSILNTKDERPFIFGDMYSESFVCAVLIHYLESIPAFFPYSLERDSAIRAVARIMMYIILYRKSHVIIPGGIFIIQNEYKLINNFRCYGYYPFMNNINKSCQPNVLALSIHNRLALVAMQPIKRGMDLTMPYGHLTGAENLGVHPKTRLCLMSSFELLRDVCSCKTCLGKVNPPISVLSADQKIFYDGLNLETDAEDMTFLKVCEAMAVLSDAPHSKEFERIRELFLNWLTFFQANESQNFVLDEKVI